MKELLALDSVSMNVEESESDESGREEQLKFEDVSELGQWVGGKADGGQERLRWGGGPHLTILRGRASARGSATWYTIIYTYTHFLDLEGHIY